MMDSDSDDSLYLDSFESDSDDALLDASNHSNTEQETTTGTEAVTDTRPAETKAAFLYHGVTISVVSGSIQKEQADVIVNSTSKDLNLRNGTASRVLLEEAGDEIQNECKEKYPNEISEGELAITGPGKLKCKFIYHGALVKYANKDSEKIQMGFFKKCLEEADKQKLTSIAIPGLGTGFLGFPRDKVAQNLQNVVKQHIDSNPSSSIVDVRFVLHHEDSLSLKAFETKLSSWEEKEKEKKAQSVCSLDIGKIHVEVKIGKLQNEEVDVIVNSTNTKLDLEKGILSKDISQAAGKSLKDECKKKYPRGLKEGEVALTGAGNLKCTRIYHVCLKDYKTLAQEASEKALTDIVYKCLTTADEKKRTSVAIPALGSKRHKYPAKVCASGTWKAIEQYTKAKGSKAVTDIRVVLFGEGHKELVEAYKQEVITYLGAPGTTSPRGTTGFCKEMYAKEINPPSYWMHYTLEKSVKEWKSETHDQGYYKLLKVDDSVKTAVEELIMNTWESAKVGHGRDASGLAQLGYDSVTVMDVQRLENIDLYENYGHTRARLFHKAGQIGVFENLEDISGSQGQITTTSFIDDDNILKRELYHEVNEHFLFHGTKPETFDHILAQGLDSRMGGEKGMFGQGMYLAESSTKADQYTDPKFDRNKEEKKMFLVRVCLGKICLLQSARNTLHRPPCFVKGCNSDSCQHEEVNRCDSVIGDKSWIFREFVIYSPYQAYPEYVITYKRK